MYTQRAKIIREMLNHPRGTFFLPQSFMRPDLGPLFVGYEASARLSELAREFPDLIFTEQKGKYKSRMLKWDVLKARFQAGTLPADIVAAINDYKNRG